MAWAISGSLSARLAEKKLLDRWLCAASLALMVTLASCERPFRQFLTRRPDLAATQAELIRGLYHGEAKRANPQWKC
ncbi:hypothetical protein MAE02_47390 [Microvirga aerophila]|uniref:Uncharacterized protein n=1 Tax=Microvirga aerophila TaxID=670291 RepID=A0A512BYM9_9HYPH|nr:hypothetical protein MAE02_47390 [Microvirga aerophila]